jgi:hypothetical protein
LPPTTRTVLEEEVEVDMGRREQKGRGSTEVAVAKRAGRLRARLGTARAQRRSAGCMWGKEVGSGGRLKVGFARSGGGKDEKCLRELRNSR